MARVPRYAVVDKKGGFFHVVNRIAAYIGDYPLQRPEVSGEFIRRFKVALSCFRIHCAELTVMGSHFHAVLFVEAFRILSRRKLERLARARWGKPLEAPHLSLVRPALGEVQPGSLRSEQLHARLSEWLRHLVQQDLCPSG